MKTLILITGGTIDKIHDPVSESLIFDKRSHIPDLLAECRAADIETQTLFLKDSLDITNQDRAEILKAIGATDHQSIVITHGTSTMIETALYFRDYLTTQSKTIVLTGAFRPYTLGKSDGPFNVGAAVMAARQSKAGIYIAMHGQVFDPALVHKDVENQKFTVK